MFFKEFVPRKSKLRYLSEQLWETGHEEAARLIDVGECETILSLFTDFLEIRTLLTYETLLIQQKMILGTVSSVNKKTKAMPDKFV